MFITNKNQNKNMKSILLVALLLMFIPFTSALTSGEGTVLFGAIFSMSVLVVFFLVCSIILEGPMKIFFLSLSFLSIVGAVGMGVSILQEFFSDLTKLVDLYGQFYILLVTLTAAGFFALIVWLIIVVFKQFNAYRGIVGEDDGF